MLLLMEYINPAPVDGNRYPHDLIGFYTNPGGWEWDFWTINTLCLQFWWRFGFYNFEKQGCLEWVVVNSHRLDGPIWLIHGFFCCRGLKVSGSQHAMKKGLAGRLFRGPVRSCSFSSFLGMVWGDRPFPRMPAVVSKSKLSGDPPLKMCK